MGYINEAKGFVSRDVIFICTILSLITLDPLFQDKLEIENTFEKEKLSSLLFSPSDLLNNYRNSTVIDLVSQIIEITAFKIKEFGLDNKLFEERLLTQYLRKFNFFYRYFYLKIYPNDLLSLSTKKINMLAIRSLFIIRGF